MSTTSNEAIKFAKLAIIVFVLFVVIEHGLLPVLTDSLGGLSTFIQLMTIAIVAALIVDLVEEAFE